MITNHFAIYVALLIVIYATLLESAKIFVAVPTPSMSHQFVFRELINELIKRDHDVTVLTPNPNYPQGKSPKNLNEIDVHNSTYALWIKWFKGLENVEQDDFLSKTKLAYRLLGEAYEEQLKDKKVQDFIANRALKFDVLILEACALPALIFSHIFKAPVIQMSSFGANPGDMEMIGAATHPLLYPMQYRRRLYNLTIFEKVNELYNEVLLTRILKEQEYEDDKMLQRLFGNTIPNLNELKKNIDMMFLNVHSIWVHNQPVPPNVIYTWGIYKKQEKVLPKDLQSYLDSSKQGAIYISFGTNVNRLSFPEGTSKLLLQVFSRLPYNILWKWDTEELPGKSENVKIMKWFPQNDLLNHPNVKLFVTQGGLQSTEEAINAGVPLIGIPMIADQEYNSEKYEYFKIGIKLNFNTLSVESFENAIKTIFADYDSYHKNIIQLRDQMQDQPRPPLENAIWWIEYVIRHAGAKHLRSRAANISWTEYYELKLIAVLLCGVIVFVTVLLLLTYYCFKCITCNINIKGKKNKIS